jgi:N-acetylmuramoyl-L-alanine amidase
MTYIKSLIFPLIFALLMQCLCFAVSAEVETLPETSDSGIVDSPETEQSEQTQQTPQPDQPYRPQMYNLPGYMRGAIIDQPLEQLGAVFDALLDIGITTVIINTRDKATGEPLYNVDMNSTELTYVSLAASMAASRHMNLFYIYDVGAAASGGMNKLISDLHRFVLKYPAQGILLSDYYGTIANAAGDGSMSGDYAQFALFAQYMRVGSGIGYGNWRTDSAEYLFRTAGDVIRQSDNTVAVGVYIDEEFPENALTAHYIDLTGYIEQHYADFAVVNTPNSLTSSERPFEASAAVWGDICAKAGIPMYILHSNDKLGAGVPGWGEDQLLRQLTAAKEIPAYQGSVFSSADSLIANPLNTSNTLQAYYENEIDEDSLFYDLEMISPKNTDFVTYEPVVDFSGRFDQNYDVYLNDERIVLNEAGNFYFEKPLQIGYNQFTVTHKGKTYVYNIERKIITLKALDDSIAEGKTLNVEGETQIIIQATAYKGAAVTASLNGTYITLTQSDTQLKDEQANTSYALFTGSFTAPQGIIGEVQALGQIAVTAEYLGYSRTESGATVSVNAKPKPVVNENINSSMYDQTTAGSGEVVGVMDPVLTPNDPVTFIRVNNDYTNVYDPQTTGKILNPEFSQLPAGTLDYLLSESGEYYISQSGRRYRAEDITLQNGVGIGENRLVVKSSGTRNGDSYFKIQLDTPVTFNIESADLNYYYNWGGAYNLRSYNPEYIYITFDNVTAVTKLPDFSANTVFDAGEWQVIEADGVPKFRMVLHLRQQGIYMGHAPFYDSEGLLTMCFEVPQNSLAGMNIIVDPGHGYGKYADIYDPGAIGHVIEQEVNLAIAIKLTEKLNAMGANAIRLPTESMFILTKSRPVMARELYGCDLYIALHANQILGDDSVRGAEAYYFTPFSQPLAEAITDSMSEYYTSNVYSDHADINRGAKYDYWDVCLQQDFPATLVEMGFVSNYEDAMAMGLPEYQDGLAQSIADGVADYLRRSNIAYGENGVTTIPDDGGGDETAQPEIPEVPEVPEMTTAAETDIPEETALIDESDIPEDTTIPEEEEDDLSDLEDLEEIE